MKDRTPFEKELIEIENDILKMGDMVSSATLQAITTLQNCDLIQANQIIADYQEVKYKRFEVEEKCIQLIATHHPMANDICSIVSVLNITNELESIGEYAECNAKITIMIGNALPLKFLFEIQLMAEKTVHMLNKSLKAFFDHNAENARKISAENDVISQFRDQIYKEMHTFIAEGHKGITRAARIISVVNNIERGAERVTNICERIVFMGPTTENINISKN